jgi:hypothetical protein
MIACILYMRVRIMCIFSRDSIKCSKYTHKGVSYDRNFLEADFNQLFKEKACLKAVRTCVIKETISLNHYIKVL